MPCTYHLRRGRDEIERTQRARIKAHEAREVVGAQREGAVVCRVAEKAEVRDERV